MLVDSNILIYAAVEDLRQHERAKRWLTEALAGDRRIALPWQALGSVVRVLTQPRMFNPPLTGPEVWEVVEGWLESPVAWIPPAGERTASILSDQ